MQQVDITIGQVTFSAVLDRELVLLRVANLLAGGGGASPPSDHPGPGFLPRPAPPERHRAAHPKPQPKPPLPGACGALLAAISDGGSFLFHFERPPVSQWTLA